ncbi:hypothetical protein SH1V18_09950 [Vallitalea longa]|uniref:Uncharacterized protein n=1 Tax=Vallitalea longa TaxID=2936439 RepID=A0A9W6DDP1_9FIRM|nr:PAS domain-containing protein [Vallitalea longa]GKX28515.1 hypothetical protein SH1V18_09950 [Vallitalea longa]
MDKNTLKQYTSLVKFLGQTLGPDYEVALHDIQPNSKSIVAIANGHISGRDVGAPMTNLGLEIIANKEYKYKDHKLNYNGVSKDQRVLRSSTFFIKDDEEELIGMLCINFDDKRYTELSEKLLQLCHPDKLIEQNHKYDSVDSMVQNSTETFSESIEEVTDTVLNKVLQDSNIPVDRLTQEERLNIVDILDKKGVFMLKGAVSTVANKLSCSEPSIYRYLAKINKKNN